MHILNHKQSPRFFASPILACVLCFLMFSLTQRSLGQDSRTEELLCYHAGAAFFVKLPHPSLGMPERLYQHITPGGSGSLLGCQLRLYNDWPSNQSHNGEIQLAVHPSVEGYPGYPVFTLELPSDELGNDVFNWPLDADFPFAAGESFFLSLAYQPATSTDTIAIVTADLGTYSGHSFFFLEGSPIWWGDNDGNPLGDMHFCANVDLNESLPFLFFPYEQIDMGRVEQQEALNLRLPIVNQGNAPLSFQNLEVLEPNWHVELDGPDSLMAPDSIFLDITWNAPSEADSSFFQLILESNASNLPLLYLPLSASNSNADVLMNEWDELRLGFIQFADSGAVTGNWRFFSGLHRPSYFVGHLAPAEGVHAEDLLVIHDVPIAENAWLEMRWCQHLSAPNGSGFRAFVWKNPTNNTWYVQDEPNLMSPAYSQDDATWNTVPWSTWGPSPVEGPQTFGFLYTGASIEDTWFLDDLEWIIHTPLQAPQVRIQQWASGILLSWDPIDNADSYLIEMQVDGQFEELVFTTEFSWLHDRILIYQKQHIYRVTAMHDTYITSGIVSPLEPTSVPQTLQGDTP